MMMPGRRYDRGTGYRYGFNGKENDNEVKGEGNEVDYGNRVYDPRIGRWLSLDPLQKKYPNETPYLYTGGNPIIFSDPDGKDRIITYYAIDKNGHNILLGTVTYKGVYAYTSTGNLVNGRYYQQDIYQNAYIDLGNPRNSHEDAPRNLITKEISAASYAGTKISNLFSSLHFGSLEGNSQGTGSGTFQPAGYALTGNSNGTTLDIKDQAGEIYGSIDIGGLLSTAKLLRIDPKVLTEMFDKSAVENVKLFFEKLSALNDLKDIGQDLIDELKEQLENRENELSSNPVTPLLPETKKAVDKCPVCGTQTDSSHINGVVRKVNEDRKKEAEKKKKEEQKNNQ
jgi:RHS repeat-associated protein